MRTLSVFLFAAAIAACSSSTAPGKAGDPSLLITNNLQNDYVFITWQDGNAIVGKDSVAPGTANQCVRFTAQPDSAKWIITASEQAIGNATPSTSSVGGNWFNPSDRPAWEVLVQDNAGSPTIFAWDSASAVNGPVYGQTRSVPPHC